jgi:hypothetical protein
MPGFNWDAHEEVPASFSWDDHPEAPSGAEALARGVAQGGSMGLGDELMGLSRAAMNKLAMDGDTADADYKAGRDSTRAANAEAEAAHPNAYSAGRIGGGVATNVAATALTGGASLLPQIGVGAAQGGLTSLGESDELDAQSLKDAGRGAVGGGLAAGAGYGLGKLAGKGLGAIGRKLEQFAAPRAAAAEQQIADKTLKEAAKETLSSRASFGATARESYSDIKDLLMLRREGLLSPGDAAKLNAFEESGGLQRLAERLGANKADRLESSLANFDTAEATYKELASTEPERAAQLAEHYGSAKYLGQQAMDRVKRYAPRIAAGVLGLGHGGASGLVEGAALGQIAGPAKDSIKRLAMLPVAQKMAYGGLGKIGKALVGNPQTLGKYGAVLGRAASKGPQELAAAHFSLAQKSPQYQEMLKQLQAGEGNQSDELASASDGDSP